MSGKSKAVHVVLHPWDVEALCGVQRESMVSYPESLRGVGVTCQLCNRERRLLRGWGVKKE